MNDTTKIPAGYYKGRAIAGSEQYAANPANGNEQIAIDFDVPEVGRQLTVFFYFTEKAAQYAVDKLRACGWSGDNIAMLSGIDANEVTVSVKYENYEGKEKMKVDVATGGRVKLENQMDERSKRAFAARMKSFVAGTATKAPPPAQRQAPTHDTRDPFGPQRREDLSDATDEIPF